MCVRCFYIGKTEPTLPFQGHAHFKTSKTKTDEIHQKF